MFDGIFWDNDGVLMETEHLYFQANVEALAGVGVQLTLDAFRTISLRRGESVLTLAPPDCDAVELKRQRDETYFRLLGEQSKVYPGVHETLQKLQGRLPMAIVTTCQRHNFLQMHRESNLIGYFDFVLTREDYRMSKPDPEPYLTACARAGLEPSRCLVIEDSERGVISATRAGMTVAAVPGEMNRSGDFSAARWLMSDITELQGLLGIV